MPAAARGLQQLLPNTQLVSYPRRMEAILRCPLKTGMDVSNEKHLVARLRAGDQASYKQLITTYGGRMLAVARRLVRNEEDARDSVQDAFLQALGKY